MPLLTMRPQLGAASDHSMLLWFRTEGPADVCVEYWPRGVPGMRRTALGPRLRAATDFTGSIALEGLTPTTRYEYRVWLAEPDGLFLAGGGLPSSFRSMPEAGKPAHVRLVWGADITGTADQPIFASMQQQAPDLALLLGDLLYADGLDATLTAYRDKARSNWSILQLAALASSTSTLAMWDDHDIVDDYWPGKDEARYAAARRTFEEYDAARNPAAVRKGELYFTATVGDVDVFVLDVRSHRSADTLPDSGEKSMLGKEQRDALLSWLAGSTAKVKIIASPVLFADHAAAGHDCWSSFSSEREAIFSFIVDHRIDDVLLLSGDQHWSAVFALRRGTGLDPYTFYEFQATPLSKSPKAAPVVRGDDVIATFGSRGVYGVVDVDTRPSPGTIALTLCVSARACEAGNEPTPTAGNAPFTLHLTTDDLGFSPPRPPRAAAQ